ncbi:hypothetical protein KC361_g8024 [Hortaea werneckii]|nr:hypothetical protein KC361_g8024 [Hortaea werneckii]
MLLKPCHFMYASALLFAITIPKHTLVGFCTIGPATETIPDEGRFAKARRVITPTWLHSNVYLAVSALLNCKWARTGGPYTIEEKTMATVQLIAGLWTGWHYYRSAIASATDSTLIIIDAQNEYADGVLKVENVVESRKAIATLLNKYRKKSGKIVHIAHQAPDGAPIFTPQTPLAKEFDEVQASDGEKVIGKVHPSSFADTPLHEHLQSTGSRKLVLCGYMAHVCVSTTARDAARLGYEVLVVADCVGDRDIPGASGPEVTKMVLHELGDAFATIVQSSEIE